MGEALKRLTPAVEDRSGAFMLDNPPVHLGLRLAAVALAEGLIKERIELPWLKWFLGLFGKQNGFDGYITINDNVYPLTVHGTNFISGTDEIQVGW